MGDSREQWQIDMDLCVDLYQDWSSRIRTKEGQLSQAQLSQAEYNGYLALDYLISIEMGSYDRLAFDHEADAGRETIEALRVFGLDRYARDLQRVYAQHSDPERREKALSKLSDGFDGRLEFEAAVAKYMRGRAS